VRSSASLSRFHAGTSFRRPSFPRRAVDPRARTCNGNARIFFAAK
jgi:hypothetical protein